MRDNTALKAVIAAVEANTEAMRAIRSEVQSGFEMVNTKLDAVMGAVTDHVNTLHGEDS